MQKPNPWGPTERPTWGTVPFWEKFSEPKFRLKCGRMTLKTVASAIPSTSFSTPIRELVKLFLKHGADVHRLPCTSELSSSPPLVESVFRGNIYVMDTILHRYEAPLSEASIEI
jgi:hypothetical protein